MKIYIKNCIKTSIVETFDNRKMANKWNQLLNFRLSNNTQEKEFVCVRVSVTPDESCIITDIRKNRGNRALRVGVSLLPCELEWVLNMLKQNSSGQIEVDNRKIFVTNNNLNTTLCVQKPDGAQQNIQISKDQITILLQNESKMVEIIANEINRFSPADLEKMDSC